MTRFATASVAAALLGVLGADALAQRTDTRVPAYDDRKHRATFPCWYDDSLEDNDSQATATDLAALRTLPTLSSCPGDDDFFAVYLKRGDVLQASLEFSHAEGNIDLSLLSPGAFGSSSWSSTDGEFARYLAREDGVHYVLVRLYEDAGVVEGNSYTLDVDIERAAPQVSAALNHSCYLRDGELSCWGNAVPEPTSLFPFVRVATGFGSTCALDIDGVVHCAKLGDDYFGQAPAVKTVWGDFTALTAGTYTACGINGLGTVTCWGKTPGSDWSSAANAYVGGQSPPDGPFTQVSAGGDHVCAVDAHGDVACWGNDSYGQAPSAVAGPFVSVAAGATSTCAIRTDLSLQCWGKSLGAVPAGPFRQVDVGTDDACALTTAGQTVCWGANTYGASAPGYPAEVHDSITVGEYHGCATIPNGYLDCWGWDYSGQVSAPPPPVPPTLEATGLYDLGVSFFAPRFKLWSDNADKARFVWLPPGATIDTSDMDQWQMPVGAKVWKAFLFDGTQVEARLIERWGYGPDDYTMIAYDWNDAETEALPVPDGVQNAYGTHDIPGAGACNACHGNHPSRVLGFSAVQLSHDGGGVTTADLIAAGRLSHPAAGGFDVATYEVPGADDAIGDGDGDTAADAIGYLHANCGHCHNESGSLAGLGMNLWVSASDAFVSDTGVYQTAVGKPMTNKSLGFDLRIAPGSPEDSGLHHRMGSREPGVQMPPLATEIVDADALDVMFKWIASLAGMG